MADLTAAEVETQWVNAVDILETYRAAVDGLVAQDGEFDVLLQSLRGTFIPDRVASALVSMRSLMSSGVSPSTARSLLEPIMTEYAQFQTGWGGGSTDLGSIMDAVYEYMHDNSETIESRAITYASPSTSGTGNGAMIRLTEDHNGYNLESCTVEKKVFRCVQDQNSGVKEEAEVFELMGSPQSRDFLLLSYDSGSNLYGTGQQGIRIVAKNARSGNGGQGSSLLQNSSFSTYDASGSPKFAGWTETQGGGQLAQDTTNYYRSHPNASTDGALQITGGGGDVTIKQGLSAMPINRIDPDTPYFFRVMLNKDVGSASGGTVTIRLGSITAAITITALGSDWQELRIGDASLAGSEDPKDQWPRNFNGDGFDVEIEWASSSSGTLLVDDVIFAPYTLIDGTYYAIRATHATAHAPFVLDDEISFTDSGGAPATGKLAWWNWIAGFRHLPTDGTPSIADP